jgi:hypothetical protein
MYVFAENTDNTLHMWSSDFTNGWLDQGTTLPGVTLAASAPDAVIAPNGHMYIFAQGPGNNLHMWSSDFTTGWVDKGTAVPSGAANASDAAAPASVIAPNGHMYVFAHGTDNNLHMWSSDFTNGWLDQGTTVPGGAVDAS